MRCLTSAALVLTSVLLHGCATPLELLRDTDVGSRQSGVEGIREEPIAANREKSITFLLQYAGAEPYDEDNERLRDSARAALLEVKGAEDRPLIELAIDDPEHCERLAPALASWYPNKVAEEDEAGVAERLAEQDCEPARKWVIEASTQIQKVPGAWRSVVLRLVAGSELSTEELETLMKSKALERILTDDEVEADLRAEVAVRFVAAAEGLAATEVAGYKYAVARVAGKKEVPDEVRTAVAPSLDDSTLQDYAADSERSAELRAAAVRQMAKRGDLRWVSKTSANRKVPKETRQVAIEVLGEQWGEDTQDAWARVCQLEPTSSLCDRVKELWAEKEEKGMLGVEAKLRERVILAAETFEQLDQALASVPAAAKKEIPIEVRKYVDMVRALEVMNKAIVKAAGVGMLQSYNDAWERVRRDSRPLVPEEELARCSGAGGVVRYDCLQVRPPSKPDWELSQTYDRVVLARRSLKDFESKMWGRLRRAKGTLTKASVRYVKAAKHVPDEWRRVRVLGRFAAIGQMPAGFFIQRLALCCRAKSLKANDEPSCHVLEGRERWSMGACR